MQSMEGNATVDIIRAFSATGRASAGQIKHRSAMDGLTSSETFGASPGTSLPIKFTDDSLISVAVLRPEDVERAASASIVDAEKEQEENEGEGGKKRKKSGFSSLFRRKSSSSSPNFTIREMTRREYLAHYAKDNSGRYIGSEEPAADCILRGKDLEKYRSHRGEGQLPQQPQQQDEWRNEDGVDEEKRKRGSGVREQGFPGEEGARKRESERGSGFRNEIVEERPRGHLTMSDEGVKANANEDDGLTSTGGRKGVGRMFGLKGLKGRGSDDGVIH